MQTKWRYFLRTLGNPEMEFAEVIAGISCFLQPVWDAVLEEQELLLKWIAPQSSWCKCEKGVRSDEE